VVKSHPTFSKPITPRSPQARNFSSAMAWTRGGWGGVCRTSGVKRAEQPSCFIEHEGFCDRRF
jgi:hypothetical protein